MLTGELAEAGAVGHGVEGFDEEVRKLQPVVGAEGLRGEVAPAVGAAETLDALRLRLGQRLPRRTDGGSAEPEGRDAAGDEVAAADSRARRPSKASRMKIAATISAPPQSMWAMCSPRPPICG